MEAAGDSELLDVGAPVQDFADATIMPGIIDLHIHTEGTLHALVEMRNYVRRQPRMSGIRVSHTAHGGGGWTRTSDRAIMSRLL